MAYNISLSCRKETHEAYKKLCSERRLSVSQEFQRFMENELECKVDITKEIKALRDELTKLKEIVSEKPEGDKF